VRFVDRQDAGRRLADVLAQRDLADPIIMALPRGGVPVAVEIAGRLDAPLDVTVVRKLGCPGQPELGIGAIGESGVRLLNDDLIAQAGITPAQIEAVAASEQAELQRRVQRYRAGRPPTPVAGRTVVVVDDGLATGFTARTAVAVLRARGAGKIVLAVPVAPPQTVQELEAVADEVVCLQTPAWFMAIGEWYTDFRQTSDEEVIMLLAAHAGEPGTAGPPSDPVARDVTIPAGWARLSGTLTVPLASAGAVIFAHGSGSSRLSPRNVAVARKLNSGGLATLLFDLLTPDEEHRRSYVFDIDLLADRLVGATRWLREQPEAAGHRLGYFGASTGAAAALQAAARLAGEVAAVVSRGGRPDLAAGHLPAVTAPTLLIVGGRDDVVVELNRQARQQLVCASRLEIVPGATHLFEEPGALEAVADLARDWFTTHLRAAAHIPTGRPVI
jgi:putative phosphoribosyl transferase